MKIGTFQNSSGQITGKIYGLGFATTNVALEATTSREGKTYFKIIADPKGEAFEVGAAFERNAGGRPYYSVSLNSPAFQSNINAALFADDNKPGQFNLVWNRPEPQEPKIENNVQVSVATKPDEKPEVKVGNSTETNKAQSRRSKTAAMTP